MSTLLRPGRSLMTAALQPRPLSVTLLTAVGSPLPVELGLMDASRFVGLSVCSRKLP